MVYKGILHIHSNYSYDGKHSIAELAAYARDKGYCFVGIADHSDSLDDSRMALMVEECRRASSSDFIVIPGIEFTCEHNLHLIGIGIQELTTSKDPFEVADFIKEKGGISIIAHPSRYNHRLPEELAAAVDGIEAWSSSYDGRFVPDVRSLQLIKVMHRSGMHVLAFSGLDLHKITIHETIPETEIACPYLTMENVLGSLKDGNFSTSNGYFRVGSFCKFSKLAILKVAAARRIYNIAKWLREKITLHFIYNNQGGK